MNQSSSKTLPDFKAEVKATLSNYSLKLSALFHPLDISSSKYREPHFLDYQVAFLNLLFYFKEKWNELETLDTLKKKQIDEGRVFLIVTLLKDFIEDPTITDSSIYELSDQFYNDLNVSDPNLESLKRAKKKLQGRLFSEFLLSDAKISTRELSDIIFITMKAPLKDKSIYAVDELACPDYFSIGLSKDIKRLKKDLLLNPESQVDVKKNVKSEKRKTLVISKDNKKLKALLNEHQLNESIPFIIDLEPWPTILHYYYAQKLKDNKEGHKLKNQLLELPAETLGNFLITQEVKTPKDWLTKYPDQDIAPKDLFQNALNQEYGKAFYMMAKALVAKFTHPLERATLLDTKNCHLKVMDHLALKTNNNDHDPFEEASVNEKNNNYLGKLLEGLRALILEGTL
jgi:hypothetical protein